MPGIVSESSGGSQGVVPDFPTPPPATAVSFLSDQGNRIYLIPQTPGGISTGQRHVPGNLLVSPGHGTYVHKQGCVHSGKVHCLGHCQPRFILSARSRPAAAFPGTTVCQLQPAVSHFVLPGLKRKSCDPPYPLPLSYRENPPP